MSAKGTMYREEVEVNESHFALGDKVKFKDSGMSGKVIKLDKEDGAEDEKYYTVKRDDGKEMKYAPNELSLIKEEKLEEKAESMVQATAARIALAAKRGKIPMSKLQGGSKDMVKMSEKDLEDFSKAKKDAPKRVEEEVELDEVSDKLLDRYRQKAFTDQPSTDDGSGKYSKRQRGRALAFDKQVGRAKVRSTNEEESLEERNKENALRRKMMDASRGARYKVSGNPVPDKEPEHKTAQDHNKAIGRALRKEELELDSIVEQSDKKVLAKKGAEIESYAKKSGGIDKADMMKVAGMLKKGDMKGAAKYAKTLDTDPRDFLLSKIMEGAVGEDLELDSISEQSDKEEKHEMAQTQAHFIKYAAEEILEYIEMGGEIEEWYQNKLSKVHSDLESLHSYMEGEKRRTGMSEEADLEEAKELSPKQNLLLRAMATDPQDINKMRRAIKLGDKALMNPVMRQEILKMLDQMMDVSLSDPTIFAKTRQIFKKRKATDTTNTE
jgi:hypothetical protein